MYNYSSSNPVLTNDTFSSNSATNGGGMKNDSSSPTLTGCTFSSNSAYNGGGIYNSSSNPTMTNVAFSNNTATGNTSIGGYGGGMYNGTSSNPIVTGATFSNNSAVWDGGGMYNNSSSPSLTNVTFNGKMLITYASNSGGVTWSASYGGGMDNVSSNPTLTNVTFSGNTASPSPSSGIYYSFSINYGGGISNTLSNPILTNVTFSNNFSHDGGGMENNDFSSIPRIQNTIFWGNTDDAGGQISDKGGTSNVKNSVVQGGYAGGTNIITADPMLGTLGNYGGFTQTIPLLAGSSAIDTANDAVCPTTDQRGVHRPQGPHCDIGAYEYIVPYTLNVNISGTGSGTVTSNPPGINCSSTCSYGFPQSTLVTLTAAAAANSIFSGWSGAGCSGTGTCQVTMSAAQSVTATFMLAKYIYLPLILR